MHELRLSSFTINLQGILVADLNRIETRSRVCDMRHLSEMDVRRKSRRSFMISDILGHDNDEETSYTSQTSCSSHDFEEERLEVLECSPSDDTKSSPPQLDSQEQDTDESNTESFSQSSSGEGTEAIVSTCSVLLLLSLLCVCMCFFPLFFFAFIVLYNYNVDLFPSICL